MNYIKNFNNSDSIIHYIPKNTDILLLGESTHGTEEFYKNTFRYYKTISFI